MKTNKELRAELVDTITKEMKPFDVVVTDRGDYISVWNCLCGSIMIAFNTQLESVAAAHGMDVRRVRTFGDGRINEADWEDRLTFKESK